MKININSLYYPSERAEEVFTPHSSRAEKEKEVDLSALYNTLSSSIQHMCQTKSPYP